MSEPVCTGCGGPRDRPRGKGWWWPTCRRCHNAYQRVWRRQQTKWRRHLEHEVKAAAYGKNVSRETIAVLQKRSKGLP
jgi:hypothetical protein